MKFETKWKRNTNEIETKLKHLQEKEMKNYTLTTIAKDNETAKTEFLYLIIFGLEISQRYHHALNR